MAGRSLTQSSVMQCPHGGQVQAVAAQARAKAGDALLTSADTFSIVGCAFTLPSGTPSPCLRVTWVTSSQRVKAGAPTLSESDTGLCMNAQNAAQGPVRVINSHPRVKAQ